MSKLLTETKEAIEQSGHKPEDIIFIGSLQTGHSCTWDEFVELAEAAKKHYYSGFGGQTLATDIVIAFSDKTYMTRGEYDGSEWWEYNRPLQIPEDTKPITTICNGSIWATIEEMNRPGGKYSSNPTDTQSRGKA